MFKRGITVSLLIVAQRIGVMAASFSDGTTNYTLGSGALVSMVEEICLSAGYVFELLCAVAALLSLYSVTVIVMKFNNGEPGVAKSLWTLFGSIIFLIAASLVLPSFFGMRNILI